MDPKLKSDLVDAINFALRHCLSPKLKFGRDEQISRVYAGQIVDQLELSRWDVSRLPPVEGGSTGRFIRGA